MIFHFLFLKASVSCSKRKVPGKCQKYDLVYKTGEKEFPRSVGSFPGFYCPPTQISPASATDRSNCLAAEAEFPGKCYS